MTGCQLLNAHGAHEAEWSQRAHEGTPFATTERGTYVCPGVTADLFAGPGGWDVAARALGIPTVGFEADRAACETRRANGLATIEGDLTAVDPRDHRGPGLIGSPPCQGFSAAGKGEARAETDRLLTLLADVRTATDVETLIADVRSWAKHEGLWLVLYPLLWALRTAPSWIALEQVPAVLPLWQAFAVILRRAGYTVATGNLSSETFGVPQTRRRAILVARSPWLTAQLGPAHLPAATHSRYNTRNPGQIEAGLPPVGGHGRGAPVGRRRDPRVELRHRR